MNLAAKHALIRKPGPQFGKHHGRAAKKKVSLQIISRKQGGQQIRRDSPAIVEVLTRKVLGQWLAVSNVLREVCVLINKLADFCQKRVVLTIACALHKEHGPIKTCEGVEQADHRRDTGAGTDQDNAAAFIREYKSPAGGAAGIVSPGCRWSCRWLETSPSGRRLTLIRYDSRSAAPDKE